MTRVNFVEDFRFMPLPRMKMRCRVKRRVAIEIEYNDAIGVVLLVIQHIVGLLCQYRVWGGMCLWTSPPGDR